MVKETRNPQGELHSYNDKPARTFADGGKEWYKNGKSHRGGDKPAIISVAGKSWWKNGELHRAGDKPAIIWSDGSKQWYKNNKRHRGGDKPAEIYASGIKFWYRNGVSYNPAFRKILRSITDEEEYVRFLSEHPELRTKPVKVTKYKRKRSVVRQHRRTKSRR